MSYLDADAFEFPQRPSDSLPELRAKNRALVEALVKLAHYARHLPSCEYEHRDYPGGCDCGLIDALETAIDKGVL